MAEEIICFGRFQLDLANRSLSRDGHPVRLGNRALDILCVLATARGAVVNKDELMARVWPGLVVEENNGSGPRIGAAQGLQCRQG